MEILIQVLEKMEPEGLPIIQASGQVEPEITELPALKEKEAPETITGLILI